MNRWLVRQIAIAVAWCLACTVWSFAAEPLAVRSAKQLFLDSRFIETSQGVQLVVNRPRVTGEKLLVPEKPWEDMALGGYTSVIQEGGRIHLWYLVMDRRGANDTSGLGNGLAYAFSADGGATWTRPSLGVIKYQGSTDNNLVMFGGGMHGETVFRNRPDAPASERYCLFVGTPNKLYVSPDGIHWTPKGRVPFLNMTGYSGLDSQNVMFWDTRIKKYVAHPRLWAGSLMRTVGRSESETLGDFPAPKVIFSRDEKDPPPLDFYTSAAIEYPFAGDAYFMFPSAYHHTPPPPSNDGPVDIQFAVSRDGVTWSRPDRSPIIRMGFDGQWNNGSMYAGYGLSRHGDELSLYYTAHDVTHGAYEKRGYLGGIFTRAIYRLDGFMSLDAGYDGGQFVTPPLVYTGDRLELNFDGSAGGWAKVELQDAGGNPLAGFSEKDSGKVVGNSVAKTVAWGGKSDLTSLRGKPVKLRVVMRDAKLYAFQFATGKGK